MSAKLYGVGLGPGDPELMTLRAHRLISNAKVVAYPTLAGAASFARSIAADVIPRGAFEIVMDVPMSVERAPAQAAWVREIRFSMALSCICSRVCRTNMKLKSCPV